MLQQTKSTKVLLRYLLRNVIAKHLRVRQFIAYTDAGFVKTRLRFTLKSSHS